MTAAQSSASKASARSIEPFTSAKSTVTCLRSPGRTGAVRGAGDASAGSGVGGEVGSRLSGWPHTAQKRSPTSARLPQPGHGLGNGRPQAVQNLTPSRLANPQAAQGKLTADPGAESPGSAPTRGASPCQEPTVERHPLTGD